MQVDGPATLEASDGFVPFKLLGTVVRSVGEGGAEVTGKGLGSGEFEDVEGTGSSVGVLGGDRGRSSSRLVGRDLARAARAWHASWCLR